MKAKKKTVGIAIYILYILYITILSRTPSLAHTVRLTPFWSYYDWIRGNWQRGLSIILNIGVFVPVGYLISALQPSTTNVKKWRKWTFIAVLFTTIAIEVVQYFLYLGYFDIDDVISNSLGGAIGLLLCEKIRDWKWNRYIPYVMLAAGLIGCIITTTNTVIYETQFDFQISGISCADGKLTLDGICTVYSREGMDYQILLRTEDAEYKSKTLIDGEKFRTSIDSSDGELYVQFSGYQPIATSVYINDGEIRYVPLNTPAPDVTYTEIEFIVETGTLKVYNAEHEAYVYQVGNRLYWLIGKEFDTSIIYHLYTTEPDTLPENRQQYGFDNRGFRIGSEKDITEMIDCGKYRVFTDIIPPEYYVTAIATGMNKGPDILWREFFRPNRF